MNHARAARVTFSFRCGTCVWGRLLVVETSGRPQLRARDELVTVPARTLTPGGE